MNTELLWEAKEELETSEDLNKVLSNIMVSEFYELYEATNNGLKYIIIVANNGAYFKPGADIAVNLLVEGKPMPINHSGATFAKKYCVGNTYLSNVFCVFSKEEVQERIIYIKEKALELAIAKA